MAVPEKLRRQTERHPCYAPAAQHRYARLHLAVAPHCNIRCNYCNRKFDCVNESRPGVASAVLTPEQALEHFMRVRREITDLSVVGIAGPGDALANWEAVRQTLTLVREQDPDVIFCLSTNGLMLPQYGPELIELGIRHVTVTVNCLDPAVGAQIYHHVSWGGTCHTGAAGAQILIDNQMAGIGFLAEQGVLVKVNLVMINGLNDRQIPVVVRQVKQLGASLANIMPLLPVTGSAFAARPAPAPEEVQALRALCQTELPQMTHCRQCRADAVGLLGNDQSARFCPGHAGRRRDGA